MRQIVYKEFPHNRKFGVELELSNNVNKKDIGYFLRYFECESEQKAVKISDGSTGWAATNNNDYWHVKYDSTCGPLGKGLDYGWEVASYIGRGLRDVEHIGGAAGYLRSSGCEVNENCGLHVHVDAADFSAYMMGLMLSRWMKIESVLLSICDPCRCNNIHAKPLSSKCDIKMISYSPILVMSFWDRIKPTNLETHDNDDKRYTLNTVNYAIGLNNRNYSRKTVELRMPECKLDKDHVSNWTSLILNFVETSSKKCQVPMTIRPSESIEEVLSYLGLGGNDEFYILDKELTDLKIWFLTNLSKKDHHLSSHAKKHLEFVSKI